MTPEEMRIAIARNQCIQVNLDEGGDIITEDSPPELTLDWLHEVESQIDPHLRPLYQHQLDKVCAKIKDPHCSCWDFIHATAEQRAEAYLRVKGLWRE